MRRRPQLNLPSMEEDEEEDRMAATFSIQNGNFRKGAVEISSTGLMRTDRSQGYTGFNKDDFKVLATIGHGASSRVELVEHVSGQRMALKVINIAEKGKRQQIMEEITTLYDAKCPSLVGFYGAFYIDGNISIAIEFMDQGCLGSILQRYGKIPEHVLAAMTFQTLWGLGYLRHAKRVHRDLKPQNILCNSKGEVKLTDFGISKELENSIGMCMTFVGTFKYMSPERVQSTPYSYASDIWSLGLVLLECLTGCYPYPESRTYIDMVVTILESAPPNVKPGESSPEFRDFIGCCLKKNPKDRVRAEVLLGAPWLEKHGATNLKDSQAIVRNWFQSMSNGTSPSLSANSSAPKTMEM